MTARPSEQGFVLLDAMIALAIIAVIGAMFVTALRSTLQMREQTALRREAVLVARSQLDAARADSVSASAGRSGELAWRIERQPYPGTANGPGLRQISVSVATADSRRPLVTLRSVELAAP